MLVALCIAAAITSSLSRLCKLALRPGVTQTMEWNQLLTFDNLARIARLSREIRC
jgi:hypothetical protein